MCHASVLDRVKRRLWGAVSRAASNRDADSDRVLHALAGVQQLRVWTEELQSACLHMVALPTRQDVRRLHRRVTVLRQRVAELDGALSGIERRAREGEAQGRAPEVSSTL